MRVLGIGSNMKVAGEIEMLLKNAGFNYYPIASGDEGIEIAKHYHYDLIMIDLDSSSASSTEVVQRIRQEKVATPIIVLSKSVETQHEVDALRNGADEYVTKPFDKGALIARINVVIRRRKGHARSLIEAGRLAINLDTRRAFVDARHVALTDVEYRILELLMLHKGSAISKDRLLQHLYDGQDEPDSKIIEVFVCKIRRKLKRVSANERFIDTVWGCGYVIITDQSADAPAQRTEAMSPVGRMNAVHTHDE